MTVYLGASPFPNLTRAQIAAINAALIGVLPDRSWTEGVWRLLFESIGEGPHQNADLMSALGDVLAEIGIEPARLPLEE